MNNKLVLLLYYHLFVSDLVNDLSNIFVLFFFQDVEATSVISFTSSVHSLNNDPNRGEIDTKIECVDSLVALLGQNSSNDLDKMSQKFLAMSSSPANCDLMRSHRVVQYLVQILHGKFLN